jgi:hypothetical protein
MVLAPQSPEGPGEATSDSAYRPLKQGATTTVELTGCIVERLPLADRRMQATNLRTADLERAREFFGFLGLTEDGIYSRLGGPVHLP